MKEYKSYQDLKNEYGLETDKDKELQLLFELPIYKWEPFHYLSGSVYETAKMLKQLRKAKGCIGISTNGMNPQEYKDRSLLRYIDEKLVEFLDSERDFEQQKRFKRFKEQIIDNQFNYLFFKRSVCDSFFLEVEGEVWESGYSDNELNAIIECYENEEKKINSFKGNASSYSVGGTPALGAMALEIVGYLPEEWKISTKYNFAVDFMLASHAVDFRGEEWVDNAKRWTKNDKWHHARNWVNSLAKTLEKVKKI